MGTRERALQAAVDLVGTHGVRALTHGRVDAAAGLPAGSTSNHFRTRAALLDGVVTWIAEHERADFAWTGTDAVPRTPEEFVALLTSMVEVQTTAHAVRTRARYALFLESGSPEAQAALRAQRRAFERWLAEMVATIGLPDSPDTVRAIMACSDGLVLHRLTVDPDAPVRPAIERVVRGCSASDRRS